MTKSKLNIEIGLHIVNSKVLTHYDETIKLIIFYVHIILLRIKLLDFQINSNV